MEPTHPSTTFVPAASGQPVGFDLDPSRRPGYPMERAPEPWPNTRYPPARQQGAPAAPRHNRPGKPLPPVFGTAVPLRGVSGLIRRAAYRYPDHLMRHWSLLLLADRVDAFRPRSRRLLRASVPALALVLLATRVYRWVNA